MYLKIESALSMCAKLALAKRKARTGPVELFGRLILANPPRGSDSVVAPARVARVEAVLGTKYPRGDLRQRARYPGPPDRHVGEGQGGRGPQVPHGGEDAG